MSKGLNPHPYKRRLTKGKLLTLGALLFSFGVATSAVATSAFYSLLEIATVGNLNLEIDMTDAWLRLGLLRNGSLLFKEDGSGFTKEELGIENTVLGEVSGMFESDWLNEQTDLSTALPKFHSRYKPGLPKTNPGYEEGKDIFVQNEFVFEAGQDCEIYLDASSYIKANVEANKKTAEEKGWDASRADALNEVVHAVRISFLTDEGYIIVNPGESNETFYGGILDLNKDGYYDDIEGKEILYGEYEGTPTYLPGETDPTSDEYKDNRNTFVANHRQGIEKVNLNSVEIKKENANKLQALTYDANDPLKEALPICHVKKGVQKRIIVSIYVEGWDKHMTDDIGSASFNANIAFTGLIK